MLPKLVFDQNHRNNRNVDKITDNLSKEKSTVITIFPCSWHLVHRSNNIKPYVSIN